MGQQCNVHHDKTTYYINIVCRINASLVEIRLKPLNQNGPQDTP